MKTFLAIFDITLEIALGAAIIWLIYHPPSFFQ